MNHDCDANCEIESLGDGVMLKASRKILPGEEITISYGPCYFGEENCMCRSCEKNCVSFYTPRNIENETFEAAGPLENEKQLFECNYCHRKFIYKSCLEGHIQKMHLMENS